LTEDAVKYSVAYRLIMERGVDVRTDIRTETKKTLTFGVCRRGLDLN